MTQEAQCMQQLGGMQLPFDDAQALRGVRSVRRMPACARSAYVRV
eukprot:CAMPEP_0170171816 /NCGR_PEP_ID=MMETSP0040_2-20121228/5013_1 /TAXON_ID=641309 /ORGANISM="Lotharella oceanica, Strain CCMP622" /LENGTH=44 /DNA_ID= /DNA_START= /DNA_END= /DNA_ORIENTATION=